MEGAVLKCPATFVDVSLFPFGSVSFYFIYHEAVLIQAHKFIIVVSSREVIYHHEMSPLSVTGLPILKSTLN